MLVGGEPGPCARIDQELQAAFDPGPRRRHQVVRKRVGREPADLDVLVVRDEYFPLSDAAQERDVEVLRPVAVLVQDGLIRAERGDRLDPDQDPGLLEDLADDGIRGLLTGFEDAADEGPLEVVRASAQQEVAVVVDDDGAGAGEPERIGSDMLAQVGDEGGYGHWSRLNPDIPNRQQIAARMLPAGCSAPGGTSPVLDRSASAGAPPRAVASVPCR